MDVTTDPVPPVPAHTKPVGSNDYFDKAWLQWFLQVKYKIDVINSNLFSISKISGSGFTVRDSNGNWIQRQIDGTANRIDVTFGDGVGGNPVIDIDANYAGQASITTVGIIGTGTWQGAVVGVPYGGTGLSSYTANNYIRALDADTLEQRTPSQVLDDIDAQKRLGSTSTSATGGSATALPAQPVGYVEVVIGGNTKKIPYYDP